jgi:hypothetical protein
MRNHRTPMQHGRGGSCSDRDGSGHRTVDDLMNTSVPQEDQGQDLKAPGVSRNCVLSLSSRRPAP